MSETPHRLKLGLPSGRFLDSSARVLSQLGCEFGPATRRSSWDVRFAQTNLIPMLLRIQDIPNLLQSGALDMGVCSDEWMAECAVEVPEILDLGWRRTSVVLAAHRDVSMTARTPLKIATPFAGLARAFFERKGMACTVLAVSGSTEALVPAICDGVVDCVETGQTLRDNGLVVWDTLLQSSVRLFSRALLPDDPSTRAIIRIFRSL